MDVLDEVGIWGRANDNHVLPDFVFAAQSRIKQRVGFYDPKVPGMSHCQRLIRSALSHYQLKMEEINRPDLHDEWESFRDDAIERALTGLEEELQRQGIQVS
jgi:hypothetical protein